MKVLKRKAGKMRQQDPNHHHHHHQVKTQPVSWNLPQTDADREKEEDQMLDRNSEGDEEQRPEELLKEQQQTEYKERPGVSEKTYLQDLRHLQTDPTTMLLLGDHQEKDPLNDLGKGHLQTDPTTLLLEDQAKEPLNDSDKGSLVRESKSMSPTSPTDPEASLQRQKKQEPGRDSELPTLMRGTTKMPQWEAKNGRAWCNLVDDRKRQQGWWREGGILLVSWVCVLLTATEFIIKRVSI